MSSPATRLKSSVRLSLAAVSLLVTGCQDYAARRDTIAFHAGEAVAHNKAVHTIDPWPAAATRAEIDLDGPRAVRAIELYEQGGSAIIAPGAGAPMPPPPAPGSAQ
jgi:hypothetical protein